MRPVVTPRRLFCRSPPPPPPTRRPPPVPHRCAPSWKEVRAYGVASAKGRSGRALWFKTTTYVVTTRAVQHSRGPGTTGLCCRRTGGKRRGGGQGSIRRGGGGGVWEPKRLCPKNGPIRFSQG